MRTLLRRIVIASVAATGVLGLAVAPASAATKNNEVNICIHSSTQYSAQVSGYNQNNVYSQTTFFAIDPNRNNGCYYLRAWWWQVGKTAIVRYGISGSNRVGDYSFNPTAPNGWVYTVNIYP